MKKEKQIQSPNLLTDYPYDSTLIRIHSKVIPLLKFLIIILEAAFIVALALGAKTDTDIIDLQKKINNLENAIVAEQQTEQTVIKVIKKTDLYKQVQSSRRTIADDITSLLTNIPLDITLDTFSLTESTVNLQVTAATPISISLLINRYLETGNVNQIALNSANLDTSDGSFDVNLDIEFK